MLEPLCTNTAISVNRHVNQKSFQGRNSAPTHSDIVATDSLCYVGWSCMVQDHECVNNTVKINISTWKLMEAFLIKS